MILYAKMAMPALQRYTRTLYLIYDFVVFLGLKVINSDDDPICFPTVEIRKSLLYRNQN